MPKSKKFVFNNHADGLYPLVTEIITCITQKEKINDDNISKLKLILVELLTNSLKHSGGEKTILEIATTADQIVIKKSDRGNGLSIRCDENLLEWPLPGKHHTNRILTVYTDAGVVLKAKLSDNCNLHFFIEESEETDTIDINSLAEHFGLMIITRASDMFEYGFDIGTCTNTFTVGLKLN